MSCIWLVSWLENETFSAMRCHFYLGTIKHAQLAAIKHDREVICRFKARAAEKGRVFHHTNTWYNLIGTITGSTPSADLYDQYLQQSKKEIAAIQD